MARGGRSGGGSHSRGHGRHNTHSSSSRSHFSSSARNTTSSNHHNHSRSRRLWSRPSSNGGCDGSSARFLILFGFIASIIFFIVGSEYETSGDSAIAIQYNAVVEDWISTYYSEFKTILDRSISISTSILSNKQLRQTKTEVYSLQNDYRSDLKDYEDYELLHRTTLPSAQLSTSVDLNLVDTFYSFPIANISQGGIPLILQKTIPLTTTCTSSYSKCALITNNNDKQACYNRPLCSEKCRDAGGVWVDSNQQCQLTMYLESICFAIKKDSVWKLNGYSAPSTNPPYATRYPLTYNDLNNRLMGCYYSSINAAAFGVGPYFPGWYSAVQPGYVSFEIRHYRDPLIEADKLTGGSLDFGAKPDSETGRNLLIVGGIIFVMVFLVPGISMCRSRNGNQRVDETAEVKPTGPTSTGNPPAILVSATISSGPPAQSVSANTSYPPVETSNPPELHIPINPYPHDIGVVDTSSYSSAPPEIIMPFADAHTSNSLSRDGDIVSMPVPDVPPIETSPPPYYS